MSEEKVKGYRFSGDIDVKFVKLLSSDGELSDISTITVEVNVFQDLFEHYMQAELVISDAVAFLDDIGGFNGGEILAVSYRTRSGDLEYKTHLFGIYDVTSRKRLDDKIETYVLNCVSVEAYQTVAKRISRSYGGTKGNTIKNMIQSVTDEFVYNSAVKGVYNNLKGGLNLSIKKEIDLDDTSGMQRFIIPNLSVDDTIDFLAREADNDNHIPYFIYYENSKGYNFKDLNTLVNEEPKEEYTYVSTNVRDDENNAELAVRDFQKIIDFNIVKQTNIIQNTKSGLFSQKTINLDILRKNKSEVNFNYTKEHSKFNTLQKPIIPGEVTGFPVQHMMQSRTGHDSDSLLSKENPLPKRRNTFIAKRQSYERHIMNTVMEVVVPGNSELDVGNTLKLNIPNATTLDKKDGKKDKYLSGKYLITKVRHIFGGKTGQTFTTVLECVKDTEIET